MAVTQSSGAGGSSRKKTTTTSKVTYKTHTSNSSNANKVVWKTHTKPKPVVRVHIPKKTTPSKKTTSYSSKNGTSTKRGN